MNMEPVRPHRRPSPLWLILPIILILACTCNAVGAATPTPAPYPTYTSYPTYTPAVPTDTPTPVPGATLLINQNANCRSGPGTAYGIADTLYQGQTVPILGRNDTNTWFEVKRPTGDGVCWVSAISVTAQEDLSKVAIVAVSAPAPAGVRTRRKGLRPCSS